jgi:hypothetical protein
VPVMILVKSLTNNPAQSSMSAANASLERRGWII